MIQWTNALLTLRELSTIMEGRGKRLEFPVMVKKVTAPFKHVENAHTHSRTHGKCYLLKRCSASKFSKIVHGPLFHPFPTHLLTTPLLYENHSGVHTCVLPQCIRPLVSHCHTLITWPIASEQILSYATPQCVGILLTVYIIQVTWPFDVWK